MPNHFNDFADWIGTFSCLSVGFKAEASQRVSAAMDDAYARGSKDGCDVTLAKVREAEASASADENLAEILRLKARETRDPKVRRALQVASGALLGFA